MLSFECQIEYFSGLLLLEIVMFRLDMIRSRPYNFVQLDKCAALD